MSDTSFKIKKSMEWHPQATAPVNPAEGETYFDSVSGQLLQYKGSLWKPLGGGLRTVETTYASPPPNPMASGSHYLIDMTSASGDLTVNLPAGAAGDVIRVSVWGQSTSGKYVTVIPNGAEIIWYNETSNASKIIGQTSNWMEFIFDVGKGWITNDSSSGSGQGKKNYILNPSAAVLETTYWTSSNFTVTRDTSTSIPRETTTKSAFKLVSTNTNATFTTDAMLLDDVDLNKKLGGEIAINVADASNWTIEVQASATSGGSYVALPLSTDVSSVTTLPATTGVFKFNFDTVASTPYIKFQIKSATTAKTAYFSDILLSPDSNTVSGTVITDWKSYSAINWASGVEFSSSYYRRVGSNIEVTGLIELSGAAPSDLIISLPTGLTIDSTIMIGVRADVGIWSYRDYNVSQRWRTADISSPYSGLHVRIVALSSNTFYLAGNENIVNAGWPITWADGDRIAFAFSVPIAEWAGSGTVNVAQNDVEYAASTTGTWNADAAAANTIYGPSGAPISGALTLYRVKVVRFQTPIQTGDKIEVELSDDGVYWFPANGATYKDRAVLPSLNSGGYAWSGVHVKKTAGNSTDVTVTFGQFVSIANDDTPAGDWIEGGYWRVRKTSAGAAVGFGEATNDAYGLVKSSSGTWTPAIADNGSGTATASGEAVTSAKYIRLGNIVSFSYGVTWTSASGAGLLRFNVGLPINCTTNGDTVGNFSTTAGSVNVKSDGYVGPKNASNMELLINVTSTDKGAVYVTGMYDLSK